MNGKCSRLVAILAVVVVMCLVPSCGHDQQLVSITLQPSGGFVFEGFGAQGQFTALGTYIHPPQTKDITNQLVWKIDIANFATLTQTGLVTYSRSDGCGNGNITATHYSNPATPTVGPIFFGTAPVKGVNDGTAKCMP
jgi:hypothetical protein